MDKSRPDTSICATIKPAKRFQKSKAERLKELFVASCEVLSEKRISDFRVKDIADRMGIGRGTLYEFIRTKNDIVYLVMIGISKKAIEYVESKLNPSHDPWTMLKAAMHANTEFSQLHTQLLWVLFQENRLLTKQQFYELKLLLERYNEIFENILKKGKQEGIFDIDDTYLVANSITSALNTWVLKKNYMNYKFNIDQYEKSVAKMLLVGVLDLKGENALQNLERIKNMRYE